MARGTSELVGKSWQISNIITALIVAVLSGLIVWWLTSPAPLVGEPVYKLEKTGKFIAKSGSTYFYKVTLSNQGKKPADNISVTIFSKKMILSDISATTSNTNPEVERFFYGRNGASAYIPNLRPSEAIVFWISFVGDESDSVRVGAASDDGVVREVSPVTPKESLRNNPWILFIGLILYVGLVFYSRKFVYKFVSRRMGKEYYHGSTNNAGFLLLHARLFEEAEDAFGAAIKKGEAGPAVISNFGLAMFMTGKESEGEALIDAAAKWVGREPDAAVVYLNQAIVETIKGSQVSAKWLQEKANGNSILSKYISRSALVRGILPAISKSI